MLIWVGNSYQAYIAILGDDMCKDITSCDGPV